MVDERHASMHCSFVLADAAELGPSPVSLRDPIRPEPRSLREKKTFVIRSNSEAEHSESDHLIFSA
jgi:hypothetical protein